MIHVLGTERYPQSWKSGQVVPVPGEVSQHIFKTLGKRETAFRESLITETIIGIVSTPPVLSGRVAQLTGSQKKNEDNRSRRWEEGKSGLPLWHCDIISWSLAVIKFVCRLNHASCWHNSTLVNCGKTLTWSPACWQGNLGDECVHWETVWRRLTAIDQSKHLPAQRVSAAKMVVTDWSQVEQKKKHCKNQFLSTVLTMTVILLEEYKCSFFRL